MGLFNSHWLMIVTTLREKKYAIFIRKDRKQMKSEAPRVTVGPEAQRKKKPPKQLIGKPTLRRSPKIQTKLSMSSHKTTAH